MWQVRPTLSAPWIFSSCYDIAVSPKSLRAAAHGRQRDTIVHLTGSLGKRSSIEDAHALIRMTHAFRDRLLESYRRMSQGVSLTV
jgi:hypothetical protein